MPPLAWRYPCAVNIDPAQPFPVVALWAALALVWIGPAVGAYRAIMIARAEAYAIRLRALKEWQ